MRGNIDRCKCMTLLYISDVCSGISAGIYLTNTSDACFHVTSTSRANIIVVEDDIQLQKILAIRSRLPHLKAIIQYSGVPEHDDVLSVNLILVFTFNFLLQRLLILVGTTDESRQRANGRRIRKCTENYCY